MVGEAVEDYIRATLALSEDGQRVSTSALAEHLGVKPSSVTAMMKRLSGQRPRLVDYKSHQGIRLTAAGTRMALDLVRRHRLIETFLVTALEYSWDEVHKEAHRLEHFVSPTFVDRIDRYLRHPEVDPHGRPIPREDGQIAERQERPLSEVEEGLAVTVSSVRADGAAFLQYLTRVGLGIKASIKVIEADTVAGVWRIEVDSGGDQQQHVISAATAGKVFVS